MLELSSVGERMNLRIQESGTFGPVSATMTNPDTTPVNLTGCTIYGSVRKTPGAGATPGVALSCSIPQPTLGKYQFEISAAGTEALIAGALQQSAESQYVWDLFLKDAAGRVVNLYYGTVQVNPRVTPPI